jgi:hypothetical protein
VIIISPATLVPTNQPRSTLIDRYKGMNPCDVTLPELDFASGVVKVLKQVDDHLGFLLCVAPPNDHWAIIHNHIC